MKKIISSAIALMIIIQIATMSVAKANDIDFKDVPKNSYGYTEIMSLKDRGFINGYLDGTFKPNTAIKRMHVAALFDRSLDLKPIRQGAEFKDVPKTHPYYHEIQNVYRAGIFDGDIDGKFNPNAILTRVQMAKILDIAFNLEPYTAIKFSDVPLGHWSEKHISTLHKYNIMPGSNGKFNPSGKVTRADYAVFLYRALDVSDNGGTNTAAFTKRVDAIQSKWQTLKPRHDGSILTNASSATVPYQLGQVHSQALKDAVNLTNFFRFLSFMPDQSRLNDAFNQEAQAASLVNAVNQTMSHSPKKPTGMDQSLFDLGYAGASSSNIGIGYSTITDSIINGYMSDFSDSNRITVGHRRWILSPQLQEVGFGFAYDINGTSHSAMKVVAPNMWDNPVAFYDKITWPAETAFPTNFFNGKDPWSISLNADVYNIEKLGDIRVQLTRKNDNKVWKFSRTTEADGFFNIDTNANYGQTPVTIIFQPKNIAEYRHEELYQVELQNLYQKNGQKTTLSFETQFFDLK